MTNLGVTGADSVVQGIQYSFIPFLTVFMVWYNPSFCLLSYFFLPENSF